MSLGKGRTILAAVLTVLIAAGGILFFSAQAVKCTLCNELFMSQVFSSKSVEAQCRKNFEAQMEVVAAESDIPARVFITILDNNSPSAESALQRLFRGDDTTFYNEDIVEQFEGLCREYLEGNGMKYGKTMIHNTAQRAARAYSDSFGIKDPVQARAFISKVNSTYGRFSSAGLMMAAVAFVPLIFLFSKKKDREIIACSAFTALGGGMLLTGLICLVLSIGLSPLITPQIYSQAVVMAVRGMLGIFTALGAVIAAVAIYLSLKFYKKSKTIDE